MAPAPASLYALLEVPQEASNEQVRQAFRNLSKRFHPDTT
ncbi:MAG TPA: molecular chaperone DnaJ, partial [Synechococcales bacterium UBA12195]|nr:molecular chaperone DnaJ [Synechococcales bacterium UBA12195]